IDARPILLLLGIALARALADKQGFVFDLFDFFLAQPPGDKRAPGPVYRDQIGFHLPLLFEKPLFRNDAFGDAFLDLFERFLIEIELRQGVHQLALLLAQVLAPDHGEQIALLDEVAGTPGPRYRLARFLAGLVVADFDDPVYLPGKSAADLRDFLWVECQ